MGFAVMVCPVVCAPLHFLHQRALLRQTHACQLFFTYEPKNGVTWSSWWRISIESKESIEAAVVT